jgi:hypothetical protein
MKQRRTGLLVLVVTMLTLLLVAACSDDADGFDGVTLAGRGLTMNISDVQQVDELNYRDTDGLYYSVGPPADGHELVAARVTIWNTRSGRLSLFVDEKSALLESIDREKAFPINPYEQRQLLSSDPADTARFTPFLWGPSDLPQDFNITGWMVFEVPEDIKFEVFEWEQVDFLTFPISVN